MAETQLWDWLKGLLPRGRYDRIESPDTAAGFPDVDYTITGGYSGTIELKDARFPARKPAFKNEQDGLHISQISWLLNEANYSGVCWIVARVRPKVFWIHGRKAVKFNGCTTLRALATHVLEGQRILPRDLKMINAMLRGELQ